MKLDPGHSAGCYGCLCSRNLGKCWMDALELALRCSSLLMRTMSRDSREAGDTSMLVDEPNDGADDDDDQLMSLRQQMNDSDCERHFNG